MSQIPPNIPTGRMRWRPTELGERMLYVELNRTCDLPFPYVLQQEWQVYDEVGHPSALWQDIAVEEQDV